MVADDSETRVEEEKPCRLVPRWREPGDAPGGDFLRAMNGFPGYRVTVKGAQAAGAAPQVPASRMPTSPVLECPHCGRELQGTVEQGVDTALATELIQAALDDTYDAAILTSADADSSRR